MKTINSVDHPRVEDELLGYSGRPIIPPLSAKSIRPTPEVDARISEHGACVGLNELAAHYNDLLFFARRLERERDGARERADAAFDERDMALKIATANKELAEKEHKRAEATEALLSEAGALLPPELGLTKSIRMHFERKS